MTNYFESIKPIVIGQLSKIAEITGLSLTALVYCLLILLIMVLFGFVILLKLRKIRKLLVKLNNNINLSLQKLLSETSQSEYGYKWKSKPKKLKKKDQNHNLKNTGAIDVDPNVHLNKFSDFSQTDLKTTAATTVSRDNFDQNFSNTASLETQIVDVLLKADKAISVQNLVGRLPSDYFDGNYNPVLDELVGTEKAPKS